MRPLRYSINITLDGSNELVVHPRLAGHGVRQAGAGDRPLAILLLFA
ncbi:MAG: hypothetical protein ACJ8AY_14905 [Gemmatimonadales bacterium]